MIRLNGLGMRVQGQDMIGWTRQNYGASIWHINEPYRTIKKIVNICHIHAEELTPGLDHCMMMKQVT